MFCLDPRMIYVTFGIKGATGNLAFFMLRLDCFSLKVNGAISGMGVQRPDCFFRN